MHYLFSTYLSQFYHFLFFLHNKNRCFIHVIHLRAFLFFAHFLLPLFLIKCYNKSGGGSMKCTIKQLAEELNLSRNTVAKALKNSNEVSSKTKQRV